MWLQESELEKMFNTIISLNPQNIAIVWIIIPIKKLREMIFSKLQFV